MFLDVVLLLFLSCLLNIVVSLEKDLKVEVNWIIFVVVDNSNFVLIIIVLLKGVYLFYFFSEIIRVDYIVVDLVGNIVKCFFKIEVEGW